MSRLTGTPNFVDCGRCGETVIDGEPCACKRFRGLCPICGEGVWLVGHTTDGRVIASCHDAFFLTDKD